MADDRDDRLGQSVEAAPARVLFPVNRVGTKFRCASERGRESSCGRIPRQRYPMGLRELRKPPRHSD